MAVVREQAFVSAPELADEIVLRRRVAGLGAAGVGGGLGDAALPTFGLRKIVSNRVENTDRVCFARYTLRKLLHGRLTCKVLKTILGLPLGTEYKKICHVKQLLKCRQLLLS